MSWSNSESLEDVFNSSFLDGVPIVDVLDDSGGCLIVVEALVEALREFADVVETVGDSILWK